VVQPKGLHPRSESSRNVSTINKKCYSSHCSLYTSGSPNTQNLSFVLCIDHKSRQSFSPRQRLVFMTQNIVSATYELPTWEKRTNSDSLCYFYFFLRSHKQQKGSLKVACRILIEVISHVFQVTPLPLI